MENISRRTAIKTALVGGAALAVSGLDAANPAKKKKVETKEPLKGNIRHSVSKWCFGSYPLDEFCGICKNIGIESIELLDPKDWPVVQKHGLTVAMCQGAGLGIDRGFNDPKLHDELVASYEQVIPMVAEAGLTNLICFSGKRNGLTDLQGWENCEKGLKRLMPLAEKHNVVLTMELLNSVGHKDYQCDHTIWGVELCRRIGSPNFKLLYDIYHMQIMEGNIIENIQKYHEYFSHIHTGEIKSSCSAGTTIKCCMTKLIILSALFRIAQNGICLLRFLKFFLTLFISRMHIRMILLGGCTESFFYFCFRCGLWNSKDLVIISFLCHNINPL